MARQQKSVHKKRGRPTGRRFVETIPVRLSVELAEAVTSWADKNDVSRSEAIRRLVEQALRRRTDHRR
jgi:metal-responsive CopG/Arc/MetJ family transcriptional regulator